MAEQTLHHFDICLDPIQDKKQSLYSFFSRNVGSSTCMSIQAEILRDTRSKLEPTTFCYQVEGRDCYD